MPHDTIKFGRPSFPVGKADIASPVGMDSRMIRAVTSHRTGASFEKYIRSSREEMAKRITEHMKMDRSTRALKAVG